ncbi:MAG: NnrT protein [Roseovarius sp.]
MKRQGWSAAQIAFALYPFGAGAAAVNVFFASLIFSWVGGPIATTAWSIGLGCLIGVPATWYFALHIRRLMDVAEERQQT